MVEDETTTIHLNKSAVRASEGPSLQYYSALRSRIREGQISRDLPFIACEKATAATSFISPIVHPYVLAYTYTHI